MAVGLSPSFFVANGQPRFDPPIELPAGFDLGTPDSPNPQVWDAPAPATIERVRADVMFYVASVFEARVARFIEQVEETSPDLATLSVERGYQRVDGTEPFGYADGVRNIARGVRSGHVFTQPDSEVDEPRWADGGSYMSFMRIVQHRDAFRALADDAARDTVIGRRRDGTRLDLEGVDPKHEPAEPAPNLPPGSHVRKAAPRGRHDDTQIFRRGLPFLEVADGRVRVGLNFASFQSSLDQFDTVLNDWMLSPNFPAEGAGPDALLDPSRGLTSIERIGLFFVPPHDPRHLAATLFDRPGRPAREGRVVVRKRVIDPTDPQRRFERAGFTFRIVDRAGQQVGDPFTTTSSGRTVFPGRLTIGATYTLEELHFTGPERDPRDHDLPNGSSEPTGSRRQYRLSAQYAIRRLTSSGQCEQHRRPPRWLLTGKQKGAGTEGKNQWVVRHGDGWAQRGEGDDRATRAFDRQQDAINAARETARRERSELIIQGERRADPRRQFAR